ncbi:MAG: NAD(+)/NADH kinase, partial [Cyanobacteria bacterium HKST-UBA05]|nr:NAD(+)/NADH kinase [Cyanobacteria bacterium HKST-UBA05]
MAVLNSRDGEALYEAEGKPDLVLVLGGDGTFLRAVRMFADDQVPLVGINTGHLGFLTRIEADGLEERLQAIM